ncbi:MAG TPA: TonB-dependent receptor [Candidatus Angelobacter sp.]
MKSILSASLTCVFAIALILSPNDSSAAETGMVYGAVTDPVGAVVSNVRVELLRQSRLMASTTTDSQGQYQFGPVPAGHYRVRATAASFAPQESSSFYVGGSGAAQIDLSLNIGTIAQEVVVSATGTEVPESQVGASVSVLSRDRFQEKLDVFDPLRQSPGAQIAQSGEHGNNASLFLRGGNSNATKVLLDGVAMNDIGGIFNFGNLPTTGVQQVELMRGPNSVLYGSDAMAGVVNLTTPRGTTPLPELAYSFDAGNFNSLRHDASLAGAFHQFDYFTEVSRFDTGNSVPDNSFHIGAYIGNFGWTPNAATDVRLTGHYNTSAVGLPNTIDIFGIPDDAFQRDQDTYISATAQNQTTSRWHNLLRYGATRLQEQFESPAPVGNPFLGNFVGNVVTVRGANGFSTTGQAILYFFGTTFPETSNISSKRDSAYFQSDYSFSPKLVGLFGVRYENERGVNLPGTRNNVSYTGELQGNLWGRAFATVGAGVEDNAVFGTAVTPRVSLAFYAVRPRATGWFSGTRLKFNYGQGIKEPSIFDQTDSLFDLLSSLPGGQQLVQQFRVPPIGPERSRSFDFGFEQGLWNGRAKLNATFFYNKFSGQIEFVSQGALQQLGVPAPVIAQTLFGASVNSGATRALGAETELQLNLGHGFSANAAYTYLDAVVQRSFSSDALFPSINPAFPNIPIGVFGPLVGDRPFRRAPHTGSFFLLYGKPGYTLSLSGYLVGRRNDSTFATDAFFGNTMLLPNKNLAEAYQKIDFSGSYRLNSHLTFYGAIENLANEHYAEVFGFPALPLTFRTGFRIRLGGESWR